MGRRSRIVLGLNSGTSADGVDAVACEITGRGLAMRVRVIGHFARRYPIDLRRRVLAVMAPAETRTEEICRLHQDIGRAFAQTATAAVKKFALKKVDLIGSHGQTICHLSPGHASRSTRTRTLGGRGKRRHGHANATATLQIGEANAIAAELRAPVVSQFRQADVAVGGQGAPLVPWTDYVLFRDAKRDRIVQNIGGIANLTWLQAGGAPDDIIAFDTGPGNMLIDALVSHFTKGKSTYDRNGTLARKGRVRREVLSQMLKHPYLAIRPPKSCGREQFGIVWMRELLKRFSQRRIPAEDWIATATHFTAATVASAYAFLLSSSNTPTEVLLCGGGAKNKSLVSNLIAAVVSNNRSSAIEFTTTSDYGISSQAKEGVSFAMLATTCVDRVQANLPGVTGARRRVILGQICSLES